MNAKQQLSNKGKAWEDVPMKADVNPGNEMRGQIRQAFRYIRDFERSIESKTPQQAYDELRQIRLHLGKLLSDFGSGIRPDQNVRLQINKAYSRIGSAAVAAKRADFNQALRFIFIAKRELAKGITYVKSAKTPTPYRYKMSFARFEAMLKDATEPIVKMKSIIARARGTDNPHDALAAEARRARPKIVRLMRAYKANVTPLSHWQKEKAQVSRVYVKLHQGLLDMNSCVSFSDNARTARRSLEAIDSSYKWFLAAHRDADYLWNVMWKDVQKFMSRKGQ